MATISSEGTPVMDVLPNTPARKPRARVVVNESPITLPPSFTTPPPRDNALRAELNSPAPRRWPYIVGALVLLVVLVVVGSAYFGKMSIQVTRKTSQISPSGTVQFTVPFTPKQFEDEVSAQASTKAQASPTTKASGTIKVINASQTSTQALVANTRFMSPDGNIYRIPTGITVPAAVKSGNSFTPGVITTTVVADGIGAKYNLDRGVKLSIPGFAGSAKGKIFSGETTTPIVGGANDATRIVHPDDAEPIFTRLEAELKSSLANKLPTDASTIVLLAENPFTVSSKTVSPDFGTAADSFEAKVKGGVSAIAVSASDLSTALTDSLFENFPSEMNSIRIDNPDALLVVDTNESTGLATIRVQGDLVLTWIPNENRLKEDLQGKSTADIESIFKRFESIASAEATFIPAWWPRIPKTERINITYR